MSGVWRAFRYGSGNGVARSHSFPITRISKESDRPNIDAKSSASDIGALVTAALLKPAILDPFAQLLQALHRL
jgi:hypothetical protein